MAHDETWTEGDDALSPLGLYDQGFNDAFHGRTVEALAIIRVLWRKLTIARRERERLRMVIETASSHDWSHAFLNLVRTTENTIAERHADKATIKALRREILRLQAELAKAKPNSRERKAFWDSFTDTEV